MLSIGVKAKKKVLKKESLFRRIRIDNRYDYQTMFTNYGT